MKRAGRRVIRQHFEGINPEALSRARTDNQVLRQEIVQLRNVLASVIDERDRYKEKLRQALGTMEDAREMVEVVPTMGWATPNGGNTWPNGDSA